MSEANATSTTGATDTTATNADTTTADPADAKSASGVDASARSKEQKEVKEPEKKFKLKYGKAEREVTEKDLIAMAQKGWAADEKFQGASKKEKQLEALVNRFKDDPDALIKHLGLDPTEVYKKQLSKELQRRVMTPEQRRLADAEAKIAEYESDKKDREKKEHDKKVSELQSHYEQQYDKEMSEAIMASGLPKTPRTVKRAAEIAYKSLEMGLELPWDHIMSLVKTSYQDEMRELFSSADADKLAEVFGGDVAKKFAKASLKSRVIDPEPVNDKNRQISKNTVDNTKEKYATEDDWEKKMNDWKKG